MQFLILYIQISFEMRVKNYSIKLAGEAGQQINAYVVNCS